MELHSPPPAAARARLTRAASSRCRRPPLRRAARPAARPSPTPWLRAAGARRRSENCGENCGRHGGGGSGGRARGRWRWRRRRRRRERAAAPVFNSASSGFAVTIALNAIIAHITPCPFFFFFSAGSSLSTPFGKLNSLSITPKSSCRIGTICSRRRRRAREASRGGRRRGPVGTRAARAPRSFASQGRPCTPRGGARASRGSPGCSSARAPWRAPPSPPQCR